MSTLRNHTCTTRPAVTQLSANLKWVCGLLFTALLLASCPAQEQDRDDQYVEIFNLIQQADSLNASSNTSKALPKYQQAEAALQNFHKTYPDWNVKSVSFRLNYLAEKIATCSAKVSAAAGTEPTSESKPGPASGTVEVKLLEAGAEPHKVLRLHPNPGDKQTLLMTTKTAMDMKLGEMPNQAMKIPPIKMTMDLTTKSVSAEGDIAYEMVMSDVSIDDDPGALPQVAEALKASLGSIKGLSGTGALSNRGFNKGMEIKLPADSNPQISQAMDQMKESFSTMAAPLPEEAVGPGARWEVKMTIKSQGMTINQTATYQLVSIEGEHLTLKSTVAQSAANQKIQNPAMPGLKVDLTKLVGKGTGELKIDLTQFLPSEATLDSHSELSMAVNAGAQKQSMAMKLDLNLRLEPK